MSKLYIVLLFSFLSINANASSINWANGQWALDPKYATKEALKEYNCANSPSTIETNPETKRYKITFSGNNSDTAKILSSSDTFFELKYDNEERVMDNGDLQVWIMYFLDEDHFVWIRKDWIKDGEILGATPGRIRCDKPLVS